MGVGDTVASLIRFGVSAPEALVEAFDRRIRSKGYTNRSEAVRDLMRAYLVEGEWEDAEGDVVGTLTIVYDHSRPELAQTLTRLQHEHLGSIVCTTHVHLDEHHCMEIIVLRGPVYDVNAIAGALVAARGVKHGKLVCSSAGTDLP